MFVTGLVNIYTRDIEAALSFYRDLLGFAETFRAPTEGIPEHVELRLNGFTVGLGTVEAAKRVHGVEAVPGSPAMVLVVWTDDVDKSYAELVAAQVPVLQPPHNTGNNNRNALLHDPDGNLVEIVAKIQEKERWLSGVDTLGAKPDRCCGLSFASRSVGGGGGITTEEAVSPQ